MGNMPMTMAIAVIKTGTDAADAGFEGGGDRVHVRDASFRARKVTTSTEFAVATPMLMMAPIKAGTLKVVCVKNRSPDNARQRAGQGGDDDERIKPALEIDHEQKINQHNRADQTDAQADITGTHGFGLAAHDNAAAARQIFFDFFHERLDVVSKRRRDRVHPRRRKYP